MSEIPKLKKPHERRHINIVIDKKVDELYRLGRQNGHDTSEFVRQVVSRAFLENEEKLKRPVG